MNKMLFFLIINVITINGFSQSRQLESSLILKYVNNDTICVERTNSSYFFDDIRISYSMDTLLIKTKKRKNIYVLLFGKRPLFYSTFSEEKKALLKGIIPIEQNVSIFKLDNEIWIRKIRYNPIFQNGLSIQLIRK